MLIDRAGVLHPHPNNQEHIAQRVWQGMGVGVGAEGVLTAVPQAASTSARRESRNHRFKRSPFRASPKPPCHQRVAAPILPPIARPIPATPRQTAASARLVHLFIL